MSEIGQDVKIVGEKLLEHCDIVARTMMAKPENFWTVAAKSILDSADALFSEEEVAYINTKIKEARRKHFSGMVVSAVSDANSASNFDLPITNKQINDMEEQDRQYKERKKAEYELKQRAEAEYMQAKLREEYDYKIRKQREEVRYADSVKSSIVSSKFGGYK